MHESRVMRDLRRVVEETLAREGTGAPLRVVKATIRIGALCPIEESHLREHWSDAFAGTGAEDCLLEVERSTDLHDPQAANLMLLALVVEDVLRGSPPATTASPSGGR